MRILGISFALLNLLLWFCVPTLCAFVDEMTGRRVNPDNPYIMTGVQELFVYFDPWLARVVFPAIYLFGFAVIPFLQKPSDIQADAKRGRAYAVVVSVLLIGFEMVWLALIAVVVFLRGPNWNLFWPGEPWDESKVVPLNMTNLSTFFWRMMGRTVDEMPWVGRELPGLVLIGGYLLAGIVLAYTLFRWGRQETSYWRWAVLVLLLQLAALVPFKMVCRWVFDIKYWIAIPEYFWNV